MRIVAPLIAAAIMALAGCASAGSTTAAGTPPPSVFTQPTASSGPCLTKACIASGMERSLPGIVDTDGSVLTKAVCKAATVKHNAGGSYTVTCVATYTDGTEWRGYGTLLHDKVYFQAVTEVR